MKIARNDHNPYQQSQIRPSELMAQAHEAARRRGTTVERKADGAQAALQKRPERDPQSAKYKAEAAKRDFERRPQFPSQFIDKTV